jgi:hypothetical protein
MAGIFPSWIATGDLDFDGVPDLAIVNAGTVGGHARLGLPRGREGTKTRPNLSCDR